MKNKILEEFRHLTWDIDRETAALRAEIGEIPCPPTCYGCCVNTATMMISEVEGLELKEGLEKLPKEVRSYTFEKAQKTIRKLEALGYTPEGMLSDAGNKAIDEIKGTNESVCPMLIGGVCAVYRHRPVICHIWGYPMYNGDRIACCHKTFVRKRDKVKPIKYVYYWRETKRLSEELGAKDKTPNCYMVARILEEMDV